MSTNTATINFIQKNRTCDIRQLALRSAGTKDVDMTYALEQIAGWQTARRKLPTWATAEGVEFPPRLSMEQCSSEATASYKAAEARRVLTEELGIDAMELKERCMADLTGGFGVDFSFMAKGFGRATYVERNERLCEVARHNFPVLGLSGAEVVCAQAEDYLEEMNAVDLIFLDPARRDAHGAKTVAMADCTPDVEALCPQLLKKARVVVVKLSPMLDWHKAVADLQGAVSEVHIVAAGGECKELLLFLTASHRGDNVQVVCVNGNERLAFSTADDALPMQFAPSDWFTGDNSALDAAPIYLYEPNASVMKAGCFALIAERFGVREVAPNSHLFVGRATVDGFPGRRFRISAISTMNKGQLRSALRGIKKANVAVRNFPLSAADLRRKLKISDGGDIYIFATTTLDGQHIVLVGSRF